MHTMQLMIHSLIAPASRMRPEMRLEGDGWQAFARQVERPSEGLWPQGN